MFRLEMGKSLHVGRVTAVLMTNDVIERINKMGASEKQPNALIFEDSNNNVTILDYNVADNDDNSNASDKYYLVGGDRDNPTGDISLGSDLSSNGNDASIARSATRVDKNSGVSIKKITIGSWVEVETFGCFRNRIISENRCLSSDDSVQFHEETTSLW